MPTCTQSNDLSGTQSNEDLIEALKPKLLDEFIPYFKYFIKEELKFSKQENILANSNTDIIKSLYKSRISKARTRLQKWIYTTMHIKNIWQ